MPCVRARVLFHKHNAHGKDSSFRCGTKTTLQVSITLRCLHCTCSELLRVNPNYLMTSTNDVPQLYTSKVSSFFKLAETQLYNYRAITKIRSDPEISIHLRFSVQYDWSCHSRAQRPLATHLACMRSRSSRAPGLSRAGRVSRCIAMGMPGRGAAL